MRVAAIASGIVAALLGATTASGDQGPPVRPPTSTPPPGPFVGGPHAPVVPGPVAASSGGSRPIARITEIVPPASYPTARSIAPTLGGADLSASSNGCVKVLVRSASVDGRQVVSVDSHGDGLIKGAVPPHLASELLAHAGPASDHDGAWAACVPLALAQSLFDPVVNVTALDPAVRMTRVGERWVLTGSREPQPVVEAEAPVPLAERREPIQIVEPQPLLQLAAATTTRGAVNARANGPTNSRQALPRRMVYVIYP